MSKQTTIAKEVVLEGVGLHTGNKSKIVFKPAPSDYGIHFIRVDLANKPDIKADWQHLSGDVAIRGTIIEKDGVKIYTIEHILASCSALQIDNVLIEIDNSEPPILDGSAKIIAEELLKAGIKELEAERTYYGLKEPVSFKNGQTEITAYPSDNFEIECTIGFDHPFLSHQEGKFIITKENFTNGIAAAKTFCFDYEIEALQANGLAKGGSLENAIVIGPTGIHNKEPLKFEDEFVRHKTLDLIGDLYLLGKQLKAKIVAKKPGHKNNGLFVKEFIKKAIIISDKKQEVKQNMESEERLIESEQIQKIIPHRYPILMVDKVKLTNDPNFATGYKAVSGNEPFFQGHFPGKPIMPGVLIVEAMAQTACVLFLSRPNMENCLAYFMGIDNVRFRKTVLPGDLLELKIEVLHSSGKKGKVKGMAYVNGKLTTEAEFMFIIMKKEA